MFAGQRTSQPILIRLQRELFHARSLSDSRQPSTKLWSAFLNSDNLRAAWTRVSENTGAETPGVDGLACRHWRDRLDQRLKELAEQLRSRRYQPDEVRLVEVPKSSGHGTRTLGILTVRDRIVQSAIKQILEPTLEPTFHPHSFGFRPGRSVVAALDAALRPLNQGSLLEANVARRSASRIATRSVTPQIGIQLDVADCFDRIDHATLLSQLREHVGHDKLLELIELILKHSGHDIGWWRWRRRVGLVQGSGLSPLLCNLALHPVDVALGQLEKQSGQRVLGLRYADDLLLLATDESHARQALRTATQSLASLRLTIRRDKLKQSRLQEGIEWLGVRLLPRPALAGRPPVFGYQIPDSKITKMLATLEALTEFRNSRGQFPNLGEFLRSLNEQLRAWREAYVFADNATLVFDLVDEIARERVQRLLQQHPAGRGGLSQFRHKLPRGFWTWKADGIQLVNLSSLAPRRPEHLIHKPQWQR